MESQQSGWSTVLCLACLFAAAVTICLQPRTGRAVSLSISGPIYAADPASVNHDPVEVLQNGGHTLTVWKSSDGYRFSIADSQGECLSERLTMKELDYEYPGLSPLVETYDRANQPDE